MLEEALALDVSDHNIPTICVIFVGGGELKKNALHETS